MQHHYNNHNEVLLYNYIIILSYCIIVYENSLVRITLQGSATCSDWTVNNICDFFITM